MKKTIFCLLALSAMIFSSAAFSQDTVKKSTKATKMTHKVTTKHHKVVKKTMPKM